MEIWYKIYQKFIRVMKKNYYVSICNLLLRAQRVLQIYFLGWFYCSAVISSSQWNVSVVSIFSYLKKCAFVNMAAWREPVSGDKHI